MVSYPNHTSWTSVTEEVNQYLVYILFPYRVRLEQEIVNGLATDRATVASPNGFVRLMYLVGDHSDKLSFFTRGAVLCS